MQDLGKVPTREGRLFVFPNVLQHCVSPFGLAEPSKPGHRKLLALFLIDPEIRVPYTANVPPQQRDWWAKKVNNDAALGKLPPELLENVIQGVDDFLISLEQVKEIREELMEERKAQQQKDESQWQNTGFSFCEH